MLLLEAKDGEATQGRTIKSFKLFSIIYHRRFSSVLSALARFRHGVRDKLVEVFPSVSNSAKQRPF